MSDLFTKRPHPTEELFILNYTPKVQYERLWDDFLLQARGLIVNSKDEVISYPFPKFFNYSEHLEYGYPIPKEPFKVYEKLDGSLCISYPTSKGVRLATRGSFTSDQALLANEILMAYGPILDPTLTYLFEVIGPDNRVVVDYPENELVLLAVKRGKEELPLEQFKHLPFRQPEVYDFDDYTHIKNLDWQNHEGFVIRFESGVRMKIKFDNYLQLHKIVTNLSEKVIYERFCARQGIDDIPDEWYGWASDTYNGFRDKYKAKEQFYREAFQTIKALSDTRKDFARLATAHKHPSVLFAMLDEKDYTHILNKIIYE